jgi:translation initiation factor 1
MAKKTKNKIGVMYSTNPDFKFDNEQTEETLVPSEQQLEVWIDRKQRGGKTATLVKGFVGEEADLKVLGKLLKSKCGVGGSAKNGEIIIQGNVREKVMEILDKEGYNYKRVGG